MVFSNFLLTPEHSLLNTFSDILFQQIGRWPFVHLLLQHDGQGTPEFLPLCHHLPILGRIKLSCEREDGGLIMTQVLGITQRSHRQCGTLRLCRNSCNWIRSSVLKLTEYGLSTKTVFHLQLVTGRGQVVHSVFQWSRGVTVTRGMPPRSLTNSRLLNVIRKLSSESKTLRKEQTDNGKQDSYCFALLSVMALVRSDNLGFPSWISQFYCHSPGICLNRDKSLYSFVLIYIKTFLGKGICICA